MAEKTLPTTTNTGTQSTTNNALQAGGQSLAGGTPSNSVQTGTATNVLNAPSSAGVPLSNRSISTINFGPRLAGQVTQAPATPRHVNPALFGVSGVLLVIAIALFWSTSRTAKTTTA